MGNNFVLIILSSFFDSFSQPTNICWVTTIPDIAPKTSYSAGKTNSHCSINEEWRENGSYWEILLDISSVQLSSVAQSCPTFCDPMNHSTPGLPVHHQLPKFTQTHIHRVGDAIQPSHPLSSPSPLAPNPSQHQSLFQWVNSSHKVAKVLEFQL